MTDPFPRDPERQAWDVVVIGTGMGGATAGYRLARAGRRVLFVEKGLMLHGGANPSGAPAMLRWGRWPERLHGETSSGPVDFYPPLGCGTGGSTGLYSAQLERFRAADFAARAWYPDAAEASLPERWPIALDALTPYYREAEALFGVCGTQDPLDPDPAAVLRPPRPMNARDVALFDSLRALGLHPYRSHLALAFAEDCRLCDEVCPVACKADAGYRCLRPALTDHGASLLAQCEALELVAGRRRVTGLRVRWQGEERVIGAKAIVVAAGAWMTPLLLLRSRSAEWPDGLANGSGLVGRNLMLHATDFLAVEADQLEPAAGPGRALSLTDFYDDGCRKLGSVQSVGERLDAASILGWLSAAAITDPARWKRPAGVAERAAAMASRRFGSATVMAAIVEDLPYHENRVLPDPAAPGGLRFVYHYPEELRRRSRHFRQRLVESLSPRLKVHVLPAVRDNLNYGHVCGTCRFGHDPAQSVLDPSNRAHELDNLYVVDASFFPSSGATNPSLTIAANALRVGDIIDSRL